MLRHVAQQLFVVPRIDDNRHARMILGCGADHGRSADVDILDAGIEIRA